MGRAHNVTASDGHSDTLTPYNNVMGHSAPVRHRVPPNWPRTYERKSWPGNVTSYGTSHTITSPRTNRHNCSTQLRCLCGKIFRNSGKFCRRGLSTENAAARFVRLSRIFNALCNKKLHVTREMFALMWHNNCILFFVVCAGMAWLPGLMTLGFSKENSVGCWTKRQQKR